MNRIMKLGRPKRAARYHAEKVVCEVPHITSDLEILATEDDPFTTAERTNRAGLILVMVTIFDGDHRTSGSLSDYCRPEQFP